MARLSQYNAKRSFDDTPEPKGRVARPRRGNPLSFVVQKHDATRLHWDFRLEWEGVLLSWAVTRGPSDDPGARRLAVRTEDHPLDYAEFEGVIDPGNYGAGTVQLWDQGTWEPLAGTSVTEGLAEGKLKFTLQGKRMTGGWTLVRMKPKSEADAKRENWLLIKERDDSATEEENRLVDTFETSVTTGRTIAEIAAGKAGRKPRARSAASPAKPRAKDPPVRRTRQAFTLPRPAFVKPQLATLADAPPDGSGWWHEVKIDGYRAQIALGDGGVSLYSRSGADWTDRFAPLVAPAQELRCRSALIDGEAMAAEGGFSDLQAALKTGAPLVFVAFDLLHLDGQDLRGKPLAKRRALLETLFKGAPTAMRLSPKIGTSAPDVLSRLCAAGGEGIVAKRADAAYRSGRGTSWLKVKCRHDAEFVIVGHAPSHSPTRPFASILLATNEGGRLVYRGKVGAGFDGEMLDELARRMAPLATRDSPFAPVPAEARGARWVKPLLVAQVTFAEFTADGRIRHGVFQGLREDKPASEVQAEALETPAVFRGQSITSPDRIVFPDVGLTKAAIAAYYDAVADRMLPHLRHRPLSLVRHPDGLSKPGFFQKHGAPGFPPALRNAEVGGDKVLLIDRPEGVLGAVQVGTIEFHIRGTRADRPAQPDRMVFDLDPDTSVGFATVRQAAADLRERLDVLGLPSWPLVTGGKGVHVVVPLGRVATTETVELFSKLFALMLAEEQPRRFTANLSKRARGGLIFVDWLRNQRQATAICPWSLRARPGAAVAVPVSWDELATLERADAFSIADAVARPKLPEPRAAALTAQVIRRLEAA